MPELLNSIIGRIGDSASVKSVFGEPITAQGRTIIPVARVCCGFGGGAVSANRLNTVKGKAAVADWWRFRWAFSK
jgi:uncharacterized spore protein YtfJ